VPSPVPYRTLRELVQNALLEDILHHRFQPGQRLIEGDLATLYGVSRAPVREAVRALEEQGLLRSVSNKGIVVSHLSPGEIREVYEIRGELEPLATRLAVPRLDDRRLDELERLLRRMDDVLDEPKEWLALNNTFHLMLYQPSGRHRLCGLIAELTNVVELYIRLFLNEPGMLPGIHREHYEILASARRRDAEECADLVRRHLEDSAETIASLAEKAGEA